ncbi:ATP-dependent DNA helicase RecG, partial [Pectobacterium brasiliense]|nr:ATP-dependent DNA helicase RecG [Pectobacterium brasiliense]
AQIRDGQWEAIDSLDNRQQKLVVVQRTGWGKRSVYFNSTKIFRERGMRTTIIESPLLSLMINQIDSAWRLGIVAE